VFVGNPEFNPFFSDCLTLCSFLAALFLRNDIESLFYAIVCRITARFPLIAEVAR